MSSCISSFCYWPIAMRRRIWYSWFPQRLACDRALQASIGLFSASKLVRAQHCAFLKPCALLHLAWIGFDFDASMGRPGEGPTGAGSSNISAAAVVQQTSVPHRVNSQPQRTSAAPLRSLLSLEAKTNNEMPMVHVQRQQSDTAQSTLFAVSLGSTMKQFSSAQHGTFDLFQTALPGICLHTQMPDACGVLNTDLLDRI